jgi:hypothetical protein
MISRTVIILEANTGSPADDLELVFQIDKCQSFGVLFVGKGMAALRLLR